MRLHLPTLQAAMAAAALCLALAPARAAPVDGFDHGLPAGASGAFVTGFQPFQGDGGAASISTTASPPAPVPGAATGNQVLKLDVATANFAGFVHVFESPGASGLAPRDWSAYDTITFWLFGSNSGTELYIDVLDNYVVDNPYPYEIWTTTFQDNFSGWKQLSFAFSSLNRKDVGNGAPDDGLGLTAVHGWALGTLATGGAQTYYVDDVQVVSELPEPDTLTLLGLALLMAGGSAHLRPGRLRVPASAQPQGPACA